MPSPDPSASLSPFQGWAVEATAAGYTALLGLGGLVALIGVVMVFLLAIVAMNVYRP